MTSIVVVTPNRRSGGETCDRIIARVSFLMRVTSSLEKMQRSADFARLG
jgi:hypothetical protein